MISNISSKIKELRERNGYSQEFMAQKLGISRPTYVQFEKGEWEPNLRQLSILSDTFQIAVESLIDGMFESQSIMVTLPKKMDKKIQRQGMRINVPQKNLNKFKEVLLYVLEKVGAKPNVGETVLYKLLYFIDFDYYERYEEQLIGATYIKNQHGPTPVEFKKIVEDMENSGEIAKINNKYFQYDQRKYLPRREPDLTKLNAREIEHINDVLARLSDKNANALSDYSHNDVPWIIAENGQRLDYEAVFYRTKQTSVRDDESDN